MSENGSTPVGYHVLTCPSKAGREDKTGQDLTSYHRKTARAWNLCIQVDQAVGRAKVPCGKPTYSE